MININITLSLIFADKLTDRELDTRLSMIERTTDRLKARYPQSAVSIDNASTNVSSELVERNKAFLEKAGRMRTPRVSDRELALRGKPELANVNWHDVEERYKALKPLGVDIFARTGGVDEVQGETFTGDVSLEEAPE